MAQMKGTGKSAGAHARGAHARATVMLLLVAVSFAVGLVFYSFFPNVLSSSWGLSGIGSLPLSREASAFFLPLLMALLAATLYYGPRMGPFSKRAEETRDHYELFILIALTFALFVQISSLLWNVGIYVGFQQLMSVGFAVFMLQLSVLVSKSKEGSFFAIRTPWTEGCDDVWEKTRALAANMFRLCAVLSLLGVFMTQYAVVFAMVPFVISFFTVMAYSYAEKRAMHPSGRAHEKREPEKRAPPEGKPFQKKKLPSGPRLEREMVDDFLEESTRRKGE